MAKDTQQNQDRRTRVRQEDINDINEHRKILDPERGPENKK